MGNIFGKGEEERGRSRSTTDLETSLINRVEGAGTSDDSPADNSVAPAGSLPTQATANPTTTASSPPTQGEEQKHSTQVSNYKDDSEDQDTTAELDSTIPEEKKEDQTHLTEMGNLRDGKNHVNPTGNGNSSVSSSTSATSSDTTTNFNPAAGSSPPQDGLMINPGEILNHKEEQKHSTEDSTAEPSSTITEEKKEDQTHLTEMGNLRDGKNHVNPTGNGNSSVSSSTQVHREPGLSELGDRVEASHLRAVWCSLKDFFPLSRSWALKKKGLSALLGNIANLAVSGILTLNIYNATYFLVWADPESVCVKVADKTFSTLFKKKIKLILITLPFIIFPLTLYVSGQASALKRNLGGIGYVAGLVIAEISYVFLISGLMTVCMSNTSYVVVSLVTVLIIGLILLLWSCCCFHPKCLRTFCFCCCTRVVDVDEEDLEAGRVV